MGRAIVAASGGGTATPMTPRGSHGTRSLRLVGHVHLGNVTRTFGRDLGDAFTRAVAPSDFLS